MSPWSQSKLFVMQSPGKSPLRSLFTSSSIQRAEAPPTANSSKRENASKRKPPRAQATKTSLRRTAIEAQLTKDGPASRLVTKSTETAQEKKLVTAFCLAEQYDMYQIHSTLTNKGFKIDPCGTDLFPQVIHVELSADSKLSSRVSRYDEVPEMGDVFIFPSGTLVAWGVPEDSVENFATKTLYTAAQTPYKLEQMETEDLNYLEDPTTEKSSIKGDIIILGTKVQYGTSQLAEDRSQPKDEKPLGKEAHSDNVLTKIAFSSGLARSTKLAVLETMLDDYFQSTRSIPSILSKGTRIPFTRSFVLQKTGQLMGVRAQLNLYSELTDSLPDLFWDSRHDLGLEGHYDHVGRALDTNIRIKTLNEKMDYAQEIASLLREQLSEQHSLRLEWIIIALIAVEVCFAFRQEWKEWSHERVEGAGEKP